MKKLILLLLPFLYSCASYVDETAKMHQAFLEGSYEQALEALDRSGIRTQDRNRLLVALEESMIKDRLGDKKTSRKLLMDGDRLADELYTTSLSRQAASFIINDAQTDYTGEDYEVVSIHTMLALSFIEENLLNEARVEAKRINTKLAQLTEGMDHKTTPYHEDGLARFLSGIIFEAKKEWDDALIDYQSALRIFESKSYQSFYKGAVPEPLLLSLYKVASIRQRSDVIKSLDSRYPYLKERYQSEEKNSATLFIIHESGQVAKKRQKDFVIPISDQIVRFSFPYIYPPIYSQGQTGAQVDGKGWFSASNVAIMSQIAHYSLEARRGRMIMKNAARLIAKGQINESVSRNYGPLAGLAANIFNAATETADTRSWTLLPDRFFVTRAALPAGTYNIRISNNGRTSQMKQVSLSAQQVLILRDGG